MNHTVLRFAAGLLVLLALVAFWIEQQHPTSPPAADSTAMALTAEPAFPPQEQSAFAPAPSAQPKLTLPNESGDSTHWLHGTVTDATSGNAIPYASLQLLDPDGWARLALANKDGSYHFPDLPVGSVSLMAFSNGYRLAERREQTSASSPTTEVNVQLHPGGRIPVRFVDLEGRRVSASLRADPLIGQQLAKFLIPKVVVGEADPAGELPGIASRYHDKRQWFYSPELRGEFDGTLYWSFPRGGTVMATIHGLVLGSMLISGEETELVITCDLDRLKSCSQFISLRIYDEATLQVLESVTISCDGPDQGFGTRSTAIDALHRVGPLPPGYYNLSIHVQGYASRSVHLHLSTLHPIPTLAVAIGRGQWLEGRVVDQEERGVVGAGILLAEEGEQLEDRLSLPSPPSLLFTNSEGRFRFLLTHGKRFSLYATADGFQSQRSSFELGEQPSDTVSLVLAPAPATEVVIPVDDPLPQLWFISPTDGELLESRAIRTFGRQQLFLPKGSYRIRALTTMGTTERSIEVGG